MDCSRGIICRGPEAPRPEKAFRGAIGSISNGDRDAEATVDLLKDEVLPRYLASFKSREIDENLVDWLWVDGREEEMPQRVCQPTVICKSTNASITVANNAWESRPGSLVEREVLGNGWTR